MPDGKPYYPLTDIQSILPVMNKISIFAGLSERQLYFVFRVLEHADYAEDEFIFRQGEPPSHIYIVKSGRVKLFLGEGDAVLELIEFDVGHCFGESSLIGIQPHTASAVAVEKTELIVLAGKALLSLYNSHPDIYGLIVLNIARETCRRLARADDILLHYVLKK